MVVGNRAHGEMGEQAVARFVGEFMVERTRMEDIEKQYEEGVGGSGGGRRQGKQKQKEEGLQRWLQRLSRVLRELLEET